MKGEINMLEKLSHFLQQALKHFIHALLKVNSLHLSCCS